VWRRKVCPLNGGGGLIFCVMGKKRSCLMIEVLFSILERGTDIQCLSTAILLRYLYRQSMEVAPPSNPGCMDLYRRGK